ncbi:DUF6531 domain-containing protein [Pseudomonas sp. B21-048]|uniref:DUF6531 domain-containing protein n=1 Tax=Pseudomonas sp. B21-048 TaxID=2895490 RepID=UPI0021602696|nr:DUF6531 domain-containing protein [Pseudomonas sp. B21-048]UVK98791.1 DUF6531 domain-containing protein [Pseudomonas sp. B21-048]
MNIKHSCGIAILLLIAAFHQNSTAEIYNWKAWYLRHQPTQHNSPDIACQAFHKELSIEYDHILGYHPAIPHETYDWKWLCRIDYIADEIAEEDGGPDPGTFTQEILLTGDSCKENQSLNKLTGMCEIESIDNSCPSNIVGNPIDFLTGHKVELETDFPISKKIRKPNEIEFSRSYSSKNGTWAHNYASRMFFDESSISIALANGKTSIFHKVGDNYQPKKPTGESLTKGESQWTYQSPENHYYTFNENGRISEIRKFGALQNIKYDESHITVTDSYGTTIKFTEDTKKQPLSFSSEDIQIEYGYDDYRQLKTVSRAFFRKSDKKMFFYQDPRDGRLLTSMTDERGVTYASWSYDDHGRAISSEHSNGAEKTNITYNPDESVTVTNALGKITNYKFGFFQGIKRITSIDGEPTVNCPSSNSTFIYDERGLLKSKTDSNGNITTYTHNDRGLETSRTEASGTTDSRTITTEWHPTLSLPVRVTQPNRSIQYTYDAEGRQLTQSITAL